MELGEMIGMFVCWVMAVGMVVIWVVCAGAKLGEGCEPEHDCSNCGHCDEHGFYSDACRHCVMFFPHTPDWKPLAGGGAGGTPAVRGAKGVRNG